jgi:hypothetical protein
MDERITNTDTLIKFLGDLIFKNWYNVQRVSYPKEKEDEDFFVLHLKNGGDIKIKIEEDKK